MKLAEREILIKESDVTPVIRNEYSARFTFESFENPTLTELRERYGLMDVIARGEDEFDKQVILMDWVHNQFKKFGRPTSPARGALNVLKAIEEGNAFFCSHYGDVMVGTAAAVGWVDRPLALRTYKEGPGSTEHTITEIWSNQWRKWVMFDPTYALYVEKDGRPLNAYEVRQEWLYHEGRDLTFVIGADRARYTKDDLPVFRAHHPGFGDLALTERTLNKLAFLGYVPHTDIMEGMNYTGFFITRDAICDGIRWHNRDKPDDPAHEPYFPLNQADLSLAPADGMRLKVSIETFTPNFSIFRHRIDGGAWRDGEPGEWELHEGENTLEAVSVNRFGVEGVPSKVVVVPQ